VELLKLKQDIANLTLIPSSGGRFEVTVNGKKVYSKLKTGKFPDFAEVVKVVRAVG
jgi:selenoprotein W-related protein